MYRPHVLLDVDGVLADFLTPALALVNKLLGTTYKPEDVKQWDFMQQFSIEGKLRDELRALIQREGFCRGILPYPGAREGVARLEEIADVYIVTASFGGTHWAREREMWLFDNFHIPTARVVSTHAKFLCCGDVLVDDNTETCKGWQQRPCGYRNGNWERAHVMRWDQPHNAQVGWSGSHTNNWDVLFGYVLAVAEVRSIA